MTVAGRYEVLDPLGAGGEARVFRARDLKSGDEVALRLTENRGVDAPPRSTPAPLHPGWVRLLERGCDPAHGDYAAFELLRGETLGAMTACGPLPVDAVRQFAEASLSAVGALHETGWIHGDLNADNFLLHDDTTWKLLDLPFHGATARPTRPLFGSIYTLSPEQIDGQPPDVRSDLFALGCLLYRAATGGYPHGGSSQSDIAIGRLRFPARPLHELAPQFPASFAAGIAQMLARGPANRPQTAAAACALLRSEDEPPHAP